MGEKNDFSGLECFFIKVGKRHFRIFVSDISHIEGNGAYCKLITLQKTYLVHLPLHYFTRILPAGFCQVHKSHIVSLKNICSFDNDHVWVNDTQIPVGSRFRDVLLEHLVILKYPTHATVPRQKTIK